jgi:hypothetical protein
MGLFDDEEIEFPKIPVNPDATEASRCAEQLAEWMRRTLPREVWIRIPKAVENATGGFPDDLRTMLDWWNGLKKMKLVSHGVNADKPSKEILSAWLAFQKSETAQECLADLDLVAEQIEASSFCRGGWFCLEKLLRGSNNKDGVPIVRNLMRGAYRDTKSGLMDTLQNYSSGRES